MIEESKNSARQEQASLASSDEAQSRTFGLSRKEGQRLVERLNALRRPETEEASMRNPIWDRFWEGGPLERKATLAPWTSMTRAGAVGELGGRGEGEGRERRRSYQIVDWERERS